MAGGRLRGVEIATFQALVESPNSPGLSLFAQVFSEDHLFGIFDQILHDPLVAVVGKRDPINHRLSVSLEKWGAAVCQAIRWFPDKDEISLLGSHHYVIPIDHEQMAGTIA